MLLSLAYCTTLKLPSLPCTTTRLDASQRYASSGLLRVFLFPGEGKVVVVVTEEWFCYPGLKGVKGAFLLHLSSSLPLFGHYHL